MFTDKTTIILGAGASRDYGYPTGAELIRRIMTLGGRLHEKYKTEPVPSSYLTRLLGDSKQDHSIIMNMDGILNFYDPISIDSFLWHYKHRKDFVYAVKTVIAQIILSSGDVRRFNKPQDLPYDRDQEKLNWYRFLWDAIVSDQSPEELAKPC